MAKIMTRITVTLAVLSAAILVCWFSYSERDVDVRSGRMRTLIPFGR